MLWEPNKSIAKRHWNGQSRIYRKEKGLLIVHDKADYENATSSQARLQCVWRRLSRQLQEWGVSWRRLNSGRDVEGWQITWMIIKRCSMQTHTTTKFSGPCMIAAAVVSDTACKPPPPGLCYWIINQRVMTGGHHTTWMVENDGINFFMMIDHTYHGTKSATLYLMLERLADESSTCQPKVLLDQDHETIPWHTCMKQIK